MNKTTLLMTLHDIRYELTKRRHQPDAVILNNIQDIIEKIFTLTCHNCGHRVKFEDNYCSQCGTKINKSELEIEGGK